MTIFVERMQAYPEPNRMVPENTSLSYESLPNMIRPESTGMADRLSDQGNEDLEDELTIDYMREVKQFYAELKDQKVPPKSKSYKCLRIDLADTGLKKSDVTAVAEKIKTGINFERAELYLLGCKLTDDLLFCLLEVLLNQSKSTLKEVELDLRDNSLTGSALPMLLEVLGAFPRLEVFKSDLADNNLTGKQDQYATVTYGSNSLKFLRLNLENTNPGSVILDRLLTSMVHFPSLQTLVLNVGSCTKTKISAAGVSSLLCSSLKNLDLCVTGMSTDSCTEVFVNLPQLCTRFDRNLVLNCSGCGDAGQSLLFGEGHTVNKQEGRRTEMMGEERITQSHLHLNALDNILQNEEDPDLKEIMKQCIEGNEDFPEDSLDRDTVSTRIDEEQPQARSFGSSSKKQGTHTLKFERVLNLRGTKLNPQMEKQSIKEFEVKHNLKIIH